MFIILVRRLLRIPIELAEDIALVDDRINLFVHGRFARGLDAAQLCIRPLLAEALVGFARFGRLVWNIGFRLILV